MATGYWLLATVLYAQTPATTTVKDTVYRSDGTPASGTVVITWPAFVTGDSKAVFGGTKTLPLTNGALAVALAPNSGATPSGTSYQVKYFQSGGVFFEETWVVPTSSPLANPAQPLAVTQTGTPGTTTYHYWCTATNANGETLLSPARITTTSNATLSGTNYNVITCATVTGATGYKAYRTPSASAPSGTGNFLVGSSATTTLNDQSNNLSSVTVPGLNTTDPRTLSLVRVTAAPSSTVTLAASQVQGNAIVSNPSATQTILAPSGTGIPLQIKGRSNNSSNVFELYDNQTTPVLRSWFDASGAFTASQAPTFSSVTSGSLLFSGSGGLLSQDNPNLFWDNTLKRLHLGPRTGLSTLAQANVNAATYTNVVLNPSAALFYGASSIIQDNTVNGYAALDGFFESRHTSGGKTFLGVLGEAYQTAAGTVNGMIGVSGYAEASAGTITDLAGAGSFNGVKVSGAAVTNAYGLYAYTNSRTSGTLTNNYGLFIANQGGVGTNNWAIKTGTGKVQFGDTLYAKAISEVRYADQFTGANAGAKIAAAITDLPTAGGTVDARGFEGAQTIATDVFAGVTKPVHLILGSGTYTITASQNIPSNATITGSGVLNTVLQVTSNTISLLVLQPQSSHIRVERLKILGPGKATSTAYGIHSKNSANNHFDSIEVTGFDKGIFFDFVTGGGSNYSNTILYSRIINNNTNIEGEEGTNAFMMLNVVFGGQAQRGLRLMDSSTLNILGGDCV